VAGSPVRFEEILQKANRIKLRMDEVRSENIKLKEELKRLKETTENYKETVDSLNEKIKILRLAQNLTEIETGDKGDLKRKLNDMIKVVDHCISMLNE
jgi:predicted nuclease with TOPRIM domain